MGDSFDIWLSTGALQNDPATPNVVFKKPQTLPKATKPPKIRISPTVVLGLFFTTATSLCGIFKPGYHKPKDLDFKPTTANITKAPTSKEIDFNESAQTITYDTSKTEATPPASQPEETFSANKTEDMTSNKNVTSDDNQAHLRTIKKENYALYKLIMQREKVNTILPMSPLEKTGIGRYNQVEIPILIKTMEKLDKPHNETAMIHAAIKFFEGEKLDTYKDHMEEFTIGIGFLLPEPKKLEKWRKDLLRDVFGNKEYSKIRTVGFKTTPAQRLALTQGFLDRSGIAKQFNRNIEQACEQPQNTKYNIKNIPRSYLAYIYTMLYQCPNAFSAFKKETFPLLKILSTQNIDYKQKKDAMVELCEAFLNNKLLKTHADNRATKSAFEEDRNRLAGKAAVIYNCVIEDMDAPLPASFIANQMFAMTRDQANDKGGPPLIVLMGKLPKNTNLSNLLQHPDAQAQKWENGTIVYLPALGVKLVKDTKGFEKTYYGEKAQELAKLNGTRIDFEKGPSLLKKFKGNLLGNNSNQKSPKPTHA